jgi:hypothetical protein
MIIILNKLFLFFLFFFIINNLKEDSKNPTNIPELSLYENQTLQIIVPKKECKYISPITIFFKSEFNDLNDSNNYDIKRINLKDKNYFVTYYFNGSNSYSVFSSLLEKNGLIRNRKIRRSNNLYFGLIMKIPPANINIQPANINIDKGATLNKYQKVEGYEKGKFFFLKDSFYRFYKYMKIIFHEDFNYMPESYIYPEDKEIIENKFKNYHLNLDDMWLIKPLNENKGTHTYIFNSLEEIESDEFLITRYIQNINLINGRKYDLILYILISSLNPLRIYLYKKGFVRISIEKYKFNINSMKKKFKHATDSAPNIENQKFINEENLNIWNLSKYKIYLEKNKIKWSDLLLKIKDIIIKSIISVTGAMYKKNRELNLKVLNFYKVISVDILIQKNFTPILLKMDYFPEIRFYNSIDKKVKTSLFLDALNIIGIAPYSRKTRNTLSINKKSNYLDYNVNNAYCELKRPRGGFELIFPINENLKNYSKYFKGNTLENKKYWKKIMKE